MIRPMLPWIAGAIAILTFYLWIHSMQAKIARQDAQINTLAMNLKAEQAARAKDVAGLTALSSGLLAASSAKSADQKALSETIDATNPTPVSAGLASLLGCLRENDNGRECATPTRSGGATPTAAAGAH
ncbi:hypothetical protein [Sphingomonas sp.]|uniref:hypothetical protein n=1 Tax=Sphingomonas sp. TaxID=28214 RepID=UPI003B3B6B27